MSYCSFHYKCVMKGLLFSWVYNCILYCTIWVFENKLTRNITEDLKICHPVIHLFFTISFSIFTNKICTVTTQKFHKSTNTTHSAFSFPDFLNWIIAIKQLSFNRVEFVFELKCIFSRCKCLGIHFSLPFYTSSPL